MGDNFGEAAPASKREDARRVATRLQMIGKMTRHRRLVEADQDAPLALASEKDVRISGAEWQVRKVADAHRMQWINASLIVTDDRAPE